MYLYCPRHKLYSTPIYHSQKAVVTASHNTDPMATYAPLWLSTSPSTLSSPFPRVGRSFTWLASPKPQQVLYKRLSNSRASCIFRKDSERFDGLRTKGNGSKDGAGETDKTEEKSTSTPSGPVSSNMTEKTGEKSTSTPSGPVSSNKTETTGEKSTSTPSEPVSSNKTEKTGEKSTSTPSEPVSSTKTEKTGEKSTSTPSEPVSSNKTEKTMEKSTSTPSEPVSSSKTEKTGEKSTSTPSEPVSSNKTEKVTIPPPEPITSKKTEKDVFETEEKLAESLAKYVADLSKTYTKTGGFFNVVLSGGTLIRSLRKLSEPPYVNSIEWSKWRVFWVDERVVPRDHIDSNYKIALDGLLSRVPILLRNVYPINDSLLDEAAADDYEARLKRLVNNRVIDTSPDSGFPVFDLILLGMGPDGHVASLFPRHALLKETQNWVAYLDDSPKHPPKRITFTFPVINSSENIAFVVCGFSHADAVHRALESGEDSVVKLPVQMISPQGQVKWFLDKDAASKLKKLI
ncbi:hypothetical protein K2173_021867 [Erythroxylum novogranatense]|uniref:6-phosphogluconolactonase n=1 Tax=Erythroxylum novogranatense TaxID=1862640 RepID=A0AAV8T3W9_9ROSI|nr:hypothetical protein K2173_021867 [Erythroxylum novogranatense]